MITTADIELGTGFGGDVDIPFAVSLVENDLQMALGRIRGTALIDTEHTDRIDEDSHWYYRFVADATNKRVTLERLRLPDGADSMAYTDLERLDVEQVERGDRVEEYERALAELMRRTEVTDSGGLTTGQGDNILSAVYEKFGAYPDEEFSITEELPFDSFDELEEHFTQEAVRNLWRDLTTVEQIGEARATAFIPTNRATGPSELPDNISEKIKESRSGEDEAQANSTGHNAD